MIVFLAIALAWLLGAATVYLHHKNKEISNEIR
jgi:hypothetical protein